VKTPLRILLLEDDTRDAELIQELLEADHFVCEITRTQTRAEFMAALEDVAKLVEGTPRGQVLTVLGRGYETVASLCEELQRRYEEFNTSVDGELQSESMKYGNDPLVEAKNTLAAELGESTRLLAELTPR